MNFEYYLGYRSVPITKGSRMSVRCVSFWFVRLGTSICLATVITACSSSRQQDKNAALIPEQIDIAGRTQPQSTDPAAKIPAPQALVKTYRQLVAERVTNATAGDFRNLKTGLSSNSSGIGYTAINCAAGVDCTNKYVEVILASGDSGGYCSGVLIAKDLLLTNRHCAQLVIKTANTSFNGGGVAILFPDQKKSENPEMNFGMAQNLIVISPTEVLNPVQSPDWAIFKINSDFTIYPKKFTPPKLNREGIKDGEKYYVYAKSPYANSKDPNAIEKRECVANYRTVFSPWMDRADLPVIELSDCPIGPGNSGAPIYNGDGELVGIIGGQYQPELLANLGALAEHAWGLLKPGTGFLNIGWGMNLACIPDLDHADSELPAGCDSSGIGMSAIDFPETVKAEAEAQLASVKVPTEQFDFEASRATVESNGFAPISQALMLQVPTCIHQGALKGLSEGKVHFKLNSSGIALSPEGIPLKSAGLLMTNEVTAVFDRQTLMKRSVAQMSIMLDNTPIILYQGNLKVCPE